MEAMKTRTIQDVPRPPFAEWYCEIKGINSTSHFRVRLEMMYMLRSICPHEPTPEFLSKGIHRVKGNYIPSVKAITDSPKISLIEFTYTPATIYAEIKFKTGQTVILSESREKLNEEAKSTFSDGMSHEDFQVIVKNRLLRRFFRRSDFMDLI